jgi:hypothetical protein
MFPSEWNPSNIYIWLRKICEANAVRRTKSAKNKCLHPEPKNESLVHSYVIENVSLFFQFYEANTYQKHEFLLLLI